MLKVLGRANSINVRKVLWACEELQLPHGQEPWGSDGFSLQSPEFVALNPNAMVPVVVHGELVLWESNTICRYLAAAHGRDDLLPTEPAARARVEQWMDWQIAELNPSWVVAFGALVRHNPTYDAAAIEAGIARWNRQMALLDEQLARTGAYAAGPAFTLADVVLGLSTQRWKMTPMSRPQLPHVEAYFERLAERPGFRLHGCNGMP